MIGKRTEGRDLELAQIGRMIFWYNSIYLFFLLAFYAKQIFKI